MSKIEDFVYSNRLPNEEALEWLWKKQAAELLGIAEKTLERRAASGDIAQMNKDRKTFYKVNDLIRFENEKDSEVLKAVVDKKESAALIRQTPTETDNNFNSLQLSELGLQERMIKAQLDKAEADAKKAIYEGNLTFSLEDAADLFNLSIVHLRADATTFKGKNQKLMITKKNLDLYLENL
jgi:hypothetical protein